jgi:hypothetical protein
MMREAAMPKCFSPSKVKEHKCVLSICNEFLTLPAELPLDEQRRLVHGFSLWLKDEYGVAVHWVVHAPTFHRKSDSKRLWLDRKTERGWQEYLDALADPEMTNLNYHAHIRFAVRRVDGEIGAFHEKTRVLDTKETGPDCVRKIRAEWEKRTNAALARTGSAARIDLRSYEDMAKAGDAPEGLEAQKHQGPKQTARIRRAKNQIAGEMPLAALEREYFQDCNRARWSCWEEIRRLEREKLRMEESVSIARKRENERSRRAKQEKLRLLQATTARERVDAVEAATTIDVPRRTSVASQRDQRSETERADPGMAVFGPTVAPVWDATAPPALPPWT